MQKFNRDKIREVIKKVCISHFELSKSNANEAAFHMTDWLDELEELVTFYLNPNGATQDEIEDAIMSFIIHAPNHLAAAGKLMIDLPVSDIFNVGAVKGIDETNNEKKDF